MWPLAIFLMIVVAFYWGAFYLTVVAWLNAVGHLFRGNFIRAALWLSLGCGMLAWWNGTEVIPHPWDVDAWLRASAWIVGFGALLTFIRFYRRQQQAAQAAAPFETRPTFVNINISIEPGSSRHVAEPTPLLRGDINAEQNPRRLSGPTIID
jgi:hypothetical protein